MLSRLERQIRQLHSIPTHHRPRWLDIFFSSEYEELFYSNCAADIVSSLLWDRKYTHFYTDANPVTLDSGMHSICHIGNISESGGNQNSVQLLSANRLEPVNFIFLFHAGCQNLCQLGWEFLCWENAIVWPLEQINADVPWITRSHHDHLKLSGHFFHFFYISLMNPLHNT